MSKKTTIKFPMEESAKLDIGEELIIEFVEACRPCWTPEDQALFDKKLPHGDQKKGDHWKGTAIKAGTITASHVGVGEKCKEDTTPHPTSLRTIIVGGG
jgi:hypothetical protein